jgi:triacylglycerol esterase/lipase EstA (alpha/beta hydrolase family)
MKTPKELIEKVKNEVATENGYKPINSKDENLNAWDVAIRITNRKAAQKELYEKVINKIADILFEPKIK